MDAVFQSTSPSNAYWPVQSSILCYWPTLRTSQPSNQSPFCTVTNATQWFTSPRCTWTLPVVLVWGQPHRCETGSRNHDQSASPESSVPMYFGRCLPLANNCLQNSRQPQPVQHKTMFIFIPSCQCQIMYETVQAILWPFQFQSWPDSS